MDKKLYKDYFRIDPKYFPQVTEALIKQGKVSWKNYFANDSFIQVLKQTCDMVNGLNERSIFIWGPYGSGKSHLLLTLISMLRAADDEITEYFTEQKLLNDLLNKFIAMKNSGKIITIHRIGSSDVKTETDLVLAVQQSIMKALEENGIENQGSASMKDSFLSFIADSVNRSYFDNVIKKDEYIAEFQGLNVDAIEDIINGDDDKIAEEMLRKVMNVMTSIGQYGILKDTNAMSEWIKDIIEKNNLKAIIFAWDEFSEFMTSHPMGLTGFQTLLEISLSSPFYFIIVTHEAEKVFADSNAVTRFLDRFQKPIEISLPENTAFKLLHQAMKLTDDPVQLNDWNNGILPSLNGRLSDIRKSILGFQRAGKSRKSDFSDEDLKSVAPIHPYAALILRQIASMFNSNQRSMFDFVINESEETRGFKWYINNHGPLDKMENILTVDLLWDFFAGKQISGLADDVRSIFMSYDGLKPESLLPEEKKVLKTILILQAVSVRISNDELLSPTAETLDLSFRGTDWSINKAVSIAKGLQEKGLIFEKPMANGKKEYCVANGNVGDGIKKHKEAAIAETTTARLINDAKLADAVAIPKQVEMRYIPVHTSDSTFNSAITTQQRHNYPERFKVIITFAMNDTEAEQVQRRILKAVSMSNNDIIFIETLTPMGKDLYNQYIDALAFTKYYSTKDKNGQGKHYHDQADSVLRQWQQNITNGAFCIYTPSNPNGERKANLSDLQDALKKYAFHVYPVCLEQYTLNGTLYRAFNLTQGVELGIKRETKSAYDKRTKEAFADIWDADEYWKDTTKQSLVIVKVKNKIEEIIAEEFKKNNGEVCIMTIFEELEKPPYGFMPNAIASFVLGFCLKEYATENYFWSDHSNTDQMTIEKMKSMITNALNKKTNPAKNYKNEYIVTMTSKVKSFLSGSATVFGIPASMCKSISDTRNQVRIKMKEFQFPIWCVKYLLDTEQYISPRETIEEVIDCYTGIANTANSNQDSENKLAEKIGEIFESSDVIIDDLKYLITDGKCREGMIAYIEQYQGGELKQLAFDIKDNGAYIDEVKKKFNAGDGNWVWSTQTADEKISDVILEYKIVKESNKSLSVCTSLQETIIEWNRRTNNIKMPCEAVAKQVGDLGVFLWELSAIKRNGTIADQSKKKFYELLVEQREAFDAFYKDQVPYFKADANSLLTDLSDTEIAEIYSSMPSGQFTKGKTEYYNYVQSRIEVFIQSQWKKKMQTLWLEKTGTKDPVEWSEKYNTPILCMVEEKNRSYARKMFDVIKSANPSEEDAKEAIEFMNQANFYSILQDADERDRLFMELIVGSNAVLLKDVNAIRNKLRAKLHESPYYWLGSTEVQRQLQSMVDKEYKLRGSEMAIQIIDKMDAAQLREYLKRRIDEDTEFGIQILKGEDGK
ncbi:MAG: hypothetical protein NC093_04995 [Alistipes sp.]|nr:hypothetical protein [Alistipes sp.]